MEILVILAILMLLLGTLYNVGAVFLAIARAHVGCLQKMANGRKSDVVQGTFGREVTAATAEAGNIAAVFYE